MTRQASYSHAISAFLSALLILTWLRNVGGLEFRRWFGLGLLCGLGMSVRVASVAHALVPASELLPALVMAARRRDARALRPPLIALFALAAGALIGFLPQMLAWKTLYGAYLTTPQGPGFMHWSGSRYGAVLFSTWNAWAAWHPLVLSLIHI